MMKCPLCKGALIWLCDYTCNEIGFCECGEGIVGIYECSDCKAWIEITTNCQERNK